MNLRGNPEAARIGVNDPPTDPIELLKRWMEQARELGVAEPNALVLGTVGDAGMPRGRVVSVKACDDRGVIFGSSAQSAKGMELAANPRCSGVLWWQEIVQQISMSGTVERLAAPESDALFAARPREAQAVATISRQSSVLKDEAELIRRVAALAAAADSIPRPAHWHAYRLVPSRIEFWHGRADRLHQRLEYRQSPAGWSLLRLQP